MSQIQLSYAVPKEDGQVIVERRVCSIVRGDPLIVDETCILAGVSYANEGRLGRGYKQRLGLVNVILGRGVLLTDLGRLAPDGDQIEASISPGGDMVAYWVFPGKKEVPRLSLQSFNTSHFRGVKGTALEDERARSRKQQAEEDETYWRWQEKEEALLEERLGG